MFRVQLGVAGCALFVLARCQTPSSTPLEFDAGTVGDGATSTTDASSSSSSSSSGSGSSSSGSSGGTGCIAGAYAGYLLRNDGKLLHADGNAPIIEAASGTSLANVTSAAGGDRHGCASTSDGKAYCWRTSASYSNDKGQLGNGAKDDIGPLDRAIPVLVSAGTPLGGVTTMGKGGGNIAVSCAVADSKAYCWGDLTWLVNKGTTLSSPYAQAITTDGSTPLTSVKQIAYGHDWACALVQGASGTEVACWGNGSAYALGQGDTASHQYPVKVTGLANPSAVAIASGSSFGNACAVVDGGQVKCWGAPCGNDTPSTTACVNPATVVGPTGAALDGVVDLVGFDDGYGRRSCVLRADKTVWCWGTGNIGNHATPIGIQNIVSLAAGGTVTDDGTYHFMGTDKTSAPNCGAL